MAWPRLVQVLLHEPRQNMAMGISSCLFCLSFLPHISVGAVLVHIQTDFVGGRSSFLAVIDPSLKQQVVELPLIDTDQWVEGMVNSKDNHVTAQNGRATLHNIAQNQMLLVGEVVLAAKLIAIQTEDVSHLKTGAAVTFNGRFRSPHQTAGKNVNGRLLGSTLTYHITLVPWHETIQSGWAGLLFRRTAQLRHQCP
jgi:hypothetical protein